jgi:hypothetical protein
MQVGICCSLCFQKASKHSHLRVALDAVVQSERVQLKLIVRLMCAACQDAKLERITGAWP